MLKNNETSEIKFSHILDKEELNLWSILLKKASPELETNNEYHQISLKEIFAEWDSNKNECDLRCALKRLSVSITYNLINKNLKREWGMFFLLVGSYIDKGNCYYYYSDHFKHIANYPEIQDELNMIGLSSKNYLA